MAHLPHCSRRRALKVLAAAAGVLLMPWRTGEARGQGLGQFAAGSPPCKPDEVPTPAAPAGPDFKPGSPERRSLREAGVAGTKLVLAGTVSGVTCGPIPRARLDFWQADAGGVYDAAGYRLRGHQFTDAAGGYRLETVVPGASKRRAPRVHVRVEPPGKPIFATQMYFPNQPLNDTDPYFRHELLMTVAEADGGRTAVFNIVLDL